MIVDAGNYRINLKWIKALFDSKKNYEERVEYISSVAVATAVPIVVVAYYMGELYGFQDSLSNKIKRLTHFYKITEMKGIGV